MTNTEPEPQGGRGTPKKTLKEDVDETLESLKSGDESIGTAVEKLMKKKEDMPSVGNVIGIVRNSGILDVFDEKVKRKYKLK